MAKSIIPSGDKAGLDYTKDLDVILQELYGNSSGAEPVIGQIHFNNGTLSICTQVIPSTLFTQFPINFSGTVGTIAGGDSVTGLNLDNFASGVVDQEIIVAFANNTSIATATAVVNRIASDITAHNVVSGVHGVTGNIVGTSDTQTLTDKTLTSPTITTPIIDAINDTTVGATTASTGAFTNVTVSGNLTVTGTTTTSGSVSTTDSDIFIDTSKTTEAALTEGAGILLGKEGTGTGNYTSATRHGITYSTSNGKWTLSDDLRINGKIDVNGVNVVTALGAWDGLTVGVAKGGTGVTSVATDALLRGAGTSTDPLVATTIGDGLKLNTDSLDVDPTEIKVDEFNGIDNIDSATLGQTIIVQDAGTDPASKKLGYSANIVDLTRVEQWARVATGAGNSTSADQVLVHTGAVGTAGYAWANLSGLTTAKPTGTLTGITDLTATGDVTLSTSGTVGAKKKVVLGNALNTGTVEVKSAVSTSIVPTVTTSGTGDHNLGSATMPWAGVHTDKLFLDSTTAVTSIDTVIVSPGLNTEIPTSKAVVDYVGSTEAGGSIIIIATDKVIPVGTIAIVTLGGVTKLWTADVGATLANRTVQLSDFVDTGTEFKETVTGFTELKTGGGAATVLIDKITVSSAQRTSGDLTLTQSVDNEDLLSVFIDGVYQSKDAYTLSGSTLSFGGDQLPESSKVEVIIGGAVNFTSGSLTDVTASGTITAGSFVGSGAGLTGLVTGIPNLPDVAEGESKHYHLQVTDDVDSPPVNDDLGSWVENSAALAITGRGCSTNPGTNTTRALCVADSGTWSNGSLQLTVNGTTATMTIETLLDQVSIDDLG